MELYQQGEYRAFEELYRRHSPRLYGYLKRRASLPGEAEDLLQQVFLKLHRYRDRYEVTLPFLPWIFAIAQNSITDHFRKHKATPMEDEKLAAIADKNSHSDDSDREVSYEDVLKHLPTDQQQLLAMRFQEGLSFDQIAERLGIKPVSVRKRVSRSVQSLKEMIRGKARKGVRS